jgi:hypothetical protein
MATIMINETAYGTVKGNVPTISELESTALTITDKISKTDKDLRDLINRLDRANRKARWINAGNTGRRRQYYG